MERITVVRGRSYAPCCYIICRVSDDGSYDPKNEADTLLIQNDWEFPGVASDFGFVACKCGGTDGTIDCDHHTATEMISRAASWLNQHEGFIIDDPGYFVFR